MPRKVDEEALRDAAWPTKADKEICQAAVTIFKISNGCLAGEPCWRPRTSGLSQQKLHANCIVANELLDIFDEELD